MKNNDDRIPLVPGVLLNKWKIEEAFAVISLVSATSDGSGSDVYELAGVFRTETEARLADIKGWWGASSKIQQALVLTDGETVFLLYPNELGYGKIKKRIYLGTEEKLFRIRDSKRN